MKASAGNGNIKQQNQIRVVRYILEHEQASRQEIALELGFSMPTVIQNVAKLIDKGWIYEAGEYGSTGGRKARILKIKENVRCVIGAEIKKNDITVILMDLSMKLRAQKRFPLAYEDSQDYYTEFGRCVNEFAEANDLERENSSELIGMGISIPGIINEKLGIVQQSHILRIKNVDLQRFIGSVPYEVCIENDANNAAFAEVKDKRRNVVYMSLNETVGGAIYLNGEIYKGDNFKSAEIGHMIIVPNGKTCYCGKKGCMDAYCSARRLFEGKFETLDDFFDSLEAGDSKSMTVWEEYLEYLALACGNLRVLFDCDIILGGDVGGYIQEYSAVFEEKLKQYSNFDYTTSFVQIGGYKHGSSAIGAARQMIHRYIEKEGVISGDE